MFNLKDATKLTIRPDFARRMLPQLVAGSALIGAVVVVAWLTGFSSSLLHPWDGLWLLAVSAATWAAMPRVAKIEQLTAYFIAGAIQPVYYYALIYGITEPTMALVIPTLIFASLLTGRGYTLYMTIFACAFVLLGAVYTQLGWTDIEPLGLLGTAQWVTFWCGLYVVSGWLSVLISKHLTESYASAVAQNEMLARTTRTLSDEPSFDSFVQTVVSTLADQLDIRYGALFLKQGGAVTTHIVIVDGRVQPAEGVSGVLPPQPAEDVPIWAAAEAEGKPFTLHDPADDPRITNKAQVREAGIRTILYVPVLTSGEMRALLALNSKERRSFRTPHLTLANALGGQLALALQLANLAAEAQQSTLLDERTRMAREIHDSLAQGFTGIVIQLDAAEDYLLDGETTGAQAHLDRARTLARESLAEARRSVYALRSPILQDRTLPEALRRMAHSLTEGTGLAVTVRQGGPLPPLSDAAERALLRIGQEALTNVIKHAHATQVTLHLTAAAGGVTLRIHDDGRGFAPNAANEGFGLVGMRERAEGVKGRLTIDAQPGGGTTIRVTVPGAGASAPAPHQGR